MEALFEVELAQARASGQAALQLQSDTIAELQGECDQLRETVTEQRDRMCELEDDARCQDDELEQPDNELQQENNMLRADAGVLSMMALRAQCASETKRADGAAASSSKLEAQLAEAHRRLLSFTRKGVVGVAAAAAGKELRSSLQTKAGAASVLAASSSNDQCERRRVNQLVAYLEGEVFNAGAGDLKRTHLLISALLDRPAVKRILLNHGPLSSKLVQTSAAMLTHARKTLGSLSSQDQKGGQRGTRTSADHLKFETVLWSLIPDDAKEEQMLNTIGELLGVHWQQIHRTLVRRTRPCATLAPAPRSPLRDSDDDAR
jgi:hypothetical protein